MLGSILGSVASSVLGGGDNKQSLAIQLIQSLLQSQGGVEGLIAKFQQGGLDDILKSWIGTGENAPISAEQITNVFGADNLQSAAQEAGVAQEDAPNLLSEFLPKIVDTLSPNGEFDLSNINTNDLIAQAAKGMLGKLFN